MRVTIRKRSMLFNNFIIIKHNQHDTRLQQLQHEIFNKIHERK